jgi:aminopeptidase
MRGIRLEFARGEVVQASAETNEDALRAILATDAGAKRSGEFAIATNHNIQRYTHQILMDEKIGGTAHVALGMGYPATGSQNRSALHWDIVCDMRKNSSITADGQTICRDGRLLV